MPFGIGLGLLIQLLCAVHALRTGHRDWIMILFFPIVGPLAYFVMVILPDMQGNKHVRTARSQVVHALNPEREVRAARDALGLADTAANRLRLADALAALGQYDQAIPLYRESIRMTVGEIDVRTQGKLAASLYETGEGVEAVALLDAIEPIGQSERDRQLLLRAKIYEQMGRREDALALYEDVVTRIPGEEARCRYAALLIAEGWDKKALKVLEEVEQRMKHLDRYQRAAEADMYRWATDTLRKLRA
jgi:hypothetical protein